MSLATAARSQRAPRSSVVLAERFDALGIVDLRVILDALENPSCRCERAAQRYYAVKHAIAVKQARRAGRGQAR